MFRKITVVWKSYCVVEFGEFMKVLILRFNCNLMSLKFAILFRISRKPRYKNRKPIFILFCFHICILTTLKYHLRTFLYRNLKWIFSQRFFSFHNGMPFFFNLVFWRKEACNKMRKFGEKHCKPKCFKLSVPLLFFKWN